MIRPPPQNAQANLLIAKSGGRMAGEHGEWILPAARRSPRLCLRVRSGYLFQPNATPSAFWYILRFASPPPKAAGIEPEPFTFFLKACR